jgi:4-oxalmesaconate hydratase
MIIDAHAHVVMTDADSRMMASLVAGRNNPAASGKGPSDELITKTVAGLMANMDEVGTDMQLISPRPFMQMHSVGPEIVVQTWSRYCNNLVHRHVQAAPKRLRGVAGLPQFRDTSPKNAIPELERCIKELGFVGCLINPDPTEGDSRPPPGLGDPFWYPLYEKLCELDVPAMIHSAGCCHERESYSLKFINESSVAVHSLMTSNVFKEFPTLKLIASHGGGAIPYQIGRFQAGASRKGDAYQDLLKKIHYDTVVHSKISLDLLFKVIGPDNCLFGTERPGTGSAPNPEWGTDYDVLKPVIESIEWLTPADRAKIFEGNCRKLYKL